MTAARVVFLADHRRTEPVPMITGAVAEGSGRRPGLTHRLLHSPFARDLRTNGVALGLLLAAIVLWAVAS